MCDTTEVERARFEWRAFGRMLAVWAIDFCCAAVVVMAIWYFVRYCVFDGERIPASAHEVSEIVSAIAWPSALVLMLLLFRNPLLRILDEAPSFVRRSFYRHGDESVVRDPDEESERLDLVSVVESECERQMSENAQCGELSADAIGRMLVKKYGGRYSVGKCIGNRRFIFDVVIEAPGRLYGVEMKIMSREDVWRCVFSRVQYVYSDLPESIKRKFVFIAVVMEDSTKIVVERMAEGFAFKTIVEGFNSNE